jgi:cytochrome c-type biogenesis protein CcmH
MAVPIWVLLGMLALAALLPAAAVLVTPARARGRREADLALYRAQLEELEREHAAGRIDEAGLRAATVEVQRRLLAAPDDAPREDRSGRTILGAALLAVPALAFGLYWWRGIPEMPSATYAERAVAQAREAELQVRDGELVDKIRERLATMAFNDPRAREGWELVGNAELSRGRLDAAAEAYRKALALGFNAELAVKLGDVLREDGKLDAAAAAYRGALAQAFSPDLAGQLTQVLLAEGRTEEAVTLLAEALPKAPQHVGLRFLSGQAEERSGRPEEARRIWTALVADAPPNVPWRAMVERRLKALP